MVDTSNKQRTDLPIEHVGTQTAQANRQLPQCATCSSDTCWQFGDALFPPLGRVLGIDADAKQLTVALLCYPQVASCHLRNVTFVYMIAACPSA